MSDDRPGAAGWTAPAKLTVSLQVTGVRDDGYHLLDSVMVTLDLADTLEISEAPDGRSRLEVVPDWPRGAGPWRDLSVGPPADNLVTRALAATGRAARVRLVKCIPPGAGLGGGSADAAAVLRWAGCTDPGVAAGLGADVPFCLVGGRARVSGIGELVEPLPYAAQSFVLLLPPFGVDTAAVYRAWDVRAAAGGGLPTGAGSNGLEAAALDVEPRLAGWRKVLEDATGRTAHLAGSGSTWFVEGDASDLGVDGVGWLELGDERAPLVATRTTPAPGGVLP
ncbi:MAG TPA: 4-(cytidine 5'-diphospho)-2-C-methyl-D-erythritol kinase [Acidimicrobiales bacterium]|nr:4-(cytidine 5'-diphospho)-2-C-methyl-D-erythritol kinase [Acidimicrobiales bacterium]